jgi:hypothetical protein
MGTLQKRATTPTSAIALANKPSPKKAKNLTRQKSEKDEMIANSFYEKAKKYIGVVDSGLGDLSSNKKYLEGFGRSHNANSR